jgi:transcriptional regulator with XRE-family HTH domain
MDDLHLGRRIRAVRVRLGLRQVDVAVRAGVSQDTVSRVERGRLGPLQLRTIRAVLAALEVDLRLEAGWRGGEIDRVADEGHATLVGAVSALLERLGWTTRAEVSFSVYGERGAIDLLAWHPVARVLLVVEVKTSLTSVEETLRRHDAKVRLAPRIAAERLGWSPTATARLLVLPDASTPRRHVARHDRVLGRVYPVRSSAAKGWLGGPSGAAGMLLFMSPALPERGRHRAVTPRRVRRPAPGRHPAQLRSRSVGDGHLAPAGTEDAPGA